MTDKEWLEEVFRPALQKHEKEEQDKYIQQTMYMFYGVINYLNEHDLEPEPQFITECKEMIKIANWEEL